MSRDQPARSTRWEKLGEQLGEVLSLVAAAVEVMDLGAAGLQADDEAARAHVGCERAPPSAAGAAWRCAAGPSRSRSGRSTMTPSAPGRSSRPTPARARPPGSPPGGGSW